MPNPPIAPGMAPTPPAIAPAVAPNVAPAAPSIMAADAICRPIITPCCAVAPVMDSIQLLPSVLY